MARHRLSIKSRTFSGSRRRVAASVRPNMPDISCTSRVRNDNPVNVLIKVTSKPGLVYEHDINNEISRYFDDQSRAAGLAVFSAGA